MKKFFVKFSHFLNTSLFSFDMIYHSFRIAFTKYTVCFLLNIIRCRPRFMDVRIRKITKSWYIIPKLQKKRLYTKRP
jgi:hypothetical protein